MCVSVCFFFECFVSVLLLLLLSFVTFMNYKLDSLVTHIIRFVFVSICLVCVFFFFFKCIVVICCFAYVCFAGFTILLARTVTRRIS